MHYKIFPLNVTFYFTHKIINSNIFQGTKMKFHGACFFFLLYTFQTILGESCGFFFQINWFYMCNTFYGVFLCCDHLFHIESNLSFFKHCYNLKLCIMLNRAIFSSRHKIMWQMFTLYSLNLTIF